MVSGLLLQVAQATEANATTTGEAPGIWKVSGSHWGAFRARIYNGQVAEIKPLEFDKNPTDMLNGIKGLIYSPSRVRYPMVRLDWLKKNKYSGDTRGNNRFVRVTWDEALDLFYQELQRVQKDYGRGHYMPVKPGGEKRGSSKAVLHICSALLVCMVILLRRSVIILQVQVKLFCLMF